MSRTKLTIVSHQRWRADDLAPFADVRADLGLDLDAAEDPDAFLWCPGGWAAPAVARHDRVRLSSAGPEWLDDLDVRLRGRDIRTSTAEELISSAQTCLPARVFAKLPEAKHEMFEAQVRSVGELVEDLRRLPDDEPVQVQTPVEFLYEVRCWVLGGDVVAHAVYMPGVARERWSQVNSPERDAEAVRWLASVISGARLEMPEAVVIDVGWCADPVAGRSGWCIIEANAPWSSDWYEADDLAAVIEAIVVSQSDVPDRWLWQPSPLLMRQAAGLLRR